MSELDAAKKAAIVAAISAYLSDAGVGEAPFRPTMFLRQTKGSGAWGRLSRKGFGASGDYRAEGVQGGRAFIGSGRA